MRNILVFLTAVLLLVLNSAAFAYFPTDFGGSSEVITVKPKPVAVIRGWPSWIGRLDEVASFQLPARIVQTGGRRVGYSFPDGWPSWIGRLEE